MNAFPRLAIGFLTIFVLLLAGESQAVLEGFSREKVRANVKLNSSHIRATVGPQWVDVEEEAELVLSPSRGDTSRVFQIRGTLQFPSGAVVVGCVVWRDDTAFQAKLRPQEQAEGVVLDIIVNDTNSFSKDPVLLEHDNLDRYYLRAYPFLPQGYRRIRIRYLLPVQAMTGEVEVFPIFSQVTGGLPRDWVLDTRGQPDSLRMVQSGMASPLKSPGSRPLSFSNTGKVSLVWGRNDLPGAERAVFDRFKGGTWAGDYAMFSGVIPDSIASRASRRAEIVVLWRWIDAETFLDPCWGENPITGEPEASRCLSEHGQRALVQAAEIRKLAERTIARGHRFSLVVDHGLDDTCRVFKLADSTVRASWDIRNWLTGVDADYLQFRIPSSTASTTSSQALEANQIRFASDVSKVGTVFSKDSGWVRHLVVTTTGPIVTGGDFLEPPDLSGLPSDVSIRSNLFDSIEMEWSDQKQAFVEAGFARSRWPGVDLTQAEAMRPGVDMALVDGVWLPRMREILSGRLLIETDKTPIEVHFQSVRGTDGRWPISLNAFAGTLAKEIQAELYAEQSSTIAKWSIFPRWLELSQDSIVPRLWALSSGRVSNVPRFITPNTLANTYGYVDGIYSLLAIPPDTLGRARSLAMADSGVPFLAPTDIFTRAGYRDGPISPIVRTPVPKVGQPQARWLGARKLRVDFDGLSVQIAEVIDVQGRVLAKLGQESLQGMGHVDIDLSNLIGRKGLVIVRLATASGWKTIPLVLP
ncbi:MAG: hypothetical protein IPK50_12185 [Fibrobacterota bacterium]|nr:MAG: hypothetical protein IPK50_12185 [Fibrobacterota bacterium]